MENLSFTFKTPTAAGGTRKEALVGVVASGNLEVLVERVLAPDTCTVDIATPVRGFDDVWKAVVEDFISRRSPGGLRLSVNDGGARPDMVSLRLAQGARAIEEPET
ncbi:MAG: malonate decarboxylase acyl carrier protein [Hyphomicrobium sp.]